MSVESLNNLSDKTYVQLGLVVSLLIATWFLSGIKAKYDNEQEGVKEGLAKLSTKVSELSILLDVRTEQRWTREQMDDWLILFKKSNSLAYPDLTVPNTRNIPIED